MLNHVQLIGNLGADPELRYTQENTAVATLSIATNKKWKDRSGNLQEKTEWHRVVVWGRMAEVAQEYLKKGSRAYVAGELTTNEWTDKEGIRRYTTEVRANNLLLLDRANGSGRPPTPPEPVGFSGPTSALQHAAKQHEGGEGIKPATRAEMAGDNDLPF